MLVVSFALETTYARLPPPRLSIILTQVKYVELVFVILIVYVTMLPTVKVVGEAVFTSEIPLEVLYVISRSFEEIVLESESLGEV